MIGTPVTALEQSVHVRYRLRADCEVFSRFADPAWKTEACPKPMRSLMRAWAAAPILGGERGHFQSCQQTKIQIVSASLMARCCASSKNFGPRLRLLARRLQIPLSPTRDQSPLGHEISSLTRHWRRLRLLPGPEGCPFGLGRYPPNLPKPGAFFISKGSISFHVVAFPVTDFSVIPSSFHPARGQRRRCGTRLALTSGRVAPTARGR